MNNYLIPVKDHPDLARDERTGMIVNINKNKHRRHQEVAAHAKKRDNELEQLKNDVDEIKAMLQKLLENGTNG